MNEQEMQQLIEAWNALQNTPSYVERFKDGKEQFEADQQDKQEVVQ